MSNHHARPSDTCRNEAAPVRRGRGDIGAADSSLEVLFGGIAIIFFVLLIVEATAYWHARNIFEESAAEGVRIAAAFDGTCAQGTAAAQALVQRRAGNWADSVQVSCALNNGVVTVSVFGATPGVLGDSIGFTARVSESTPKER
jgi:hypothetical protein